MTQDQISVCHAIAKLYNSWAREMKEPKKMNRSEKLTAERDELASKIQRLKEFMKTDTFKLLDDDDQMIMKEQRDAMKMYKRALDLRLYWDIY